MKRAFMILALSSTAAMAAQDYASLAKYPDFTGFWIPAFDGGPGPGRGVGGPSTGAAPRGGRFAGGAPLKPEAAAKLEQFGSADDPGDRSRYCSPFGFAGNNALFTGFDIVYSPGRVTLLNEEGLVRRIYLGRKMPTDGVDSLGGTSVGHWEQDTLVVETAYLEPQSKYPAAMIAGASPIGRNVHIVERFKRVGDRLQIAMEMTAPDLFTAPFATTRSYRRDDSHWPIQRTSCLDNDRLVDPVTGKQRFDLTPPADIPPPPAD